MKNEDMGRRSLWAWSAAAAAAPMANASGAGWFACAVLGGILLPLGELARPGWKRMGRVMASIQMVWMAVVLGVLLADAKGYWPSPNGWVVPLTLLALTMLPGESSRIARVGAVLLLSMLVLLAPVGLSGLAAAEAGHMGLQWNGWALALIPALLLPGLAGCFSEQRHENGKPLAAVWLFAVVVGAVTQGILGSALCQMEPVPFHTAAQTMRLGGLSRFEVLISMAMTLGYYALGSYLMGCIKTMAQAARIRQTTAVWLSGAAAAAVGAAGVIPSWLAAGGCALLWGVAPAVYGKRKLKKGEKSA